MVTLIPTPSFSTESFYQIGPALASLNSNDLHQVRFLPGLFFAVLYTNKRSFFACWAVFEPGVRMRSVIFLLIDVEPLQLQIALVAPWTLLTICTNRSTMVSRL